MRALVVGTIEDNAAHAHLAHPANLILSHEAQYRPCIDPID